MDIYARASAKALGIELRELADWQCCGAVYPQASDEIASRLCAVRALENARKEDGKLVTTVFGLSSRNKAHQLRYGTAMKTSAPRLPII